jgi:uncharacterized membrane protein YphA (DoxX/SURF4 family)
MSVHTMTGDPTQADIRAAAGVNDTILAIGRVFIALIFVSSGVEKFMDLGVTASAISSKGLPLANVLAVLTAILEAGGGLLIIIGWQTRLVALLLAIFCLLLSRLLASAARAAARQQHDSLHEELEHDRRLPDAVRGRRRTLFARWPVHSSGISADVTASAAASPARCARASPASRYDRRRILPARRPAHSSPPVARRRSRLRPRP